MTLKAHALIFKHSRFYDLTPQPSDQVAAMRITIHYLTAVVILTIYGGQV